MEIFLGAMTFVMGACVGSFVNMLGYRTAERYGITNFKLRITNKDRSFCDYCGRQLKWYENVPVVSWVIQRGKTKCCDKKLPLEYPLVEIFMGIIFLILNFKFLIFNQFQIYQFIIGIIIATLLVFSTVFDLKYMILPDFSTYILIGLAAIFYHNWLSGLGAGLFLLALYLITKGKGMGFGDVKLALFMGLFLGFPNIIMAFYLAFILGAIVGLGLMGLKRVKRNQPIPFGPFLIIGLVISFVWGNDLMYYFSRWF